MASISCSLKAWHVRCRSPETRYLSSVTRWLGHQMETFSALLAICAGNSSVTGEFPAQRPVTRNFDVFSHLHLNTRLSKHPWSWWFETLSRPLRRHCDVWYLWFKTAHVYHTICPPRKHGLLSELPQFRNPVSQLFHVKSEYKNHESVLEHKGHIPRSHRKCQDYVYIKWEYWSTIY